MKNIYPLLLCLFLNSVVWSQKQSLSSQRVSVSIDHLAPLKHLHAKYFTFNLQESYVNEQGVPVFESINAPKLGVRKIYKEYLKELQGMRGTSFVDNLSFSELVLNDQPFIYVEIKAGDLFFTEANLRTPIVRILNFYNKDISFTMDAQVKISYVHNGNFTTIIDTNLNRTTVHKKAFPKDYKPEVGIKQSVSVKDSLDPLWLREQNRVRLVWRQDVLQDFIKDCVKEYNLRVVGGVRTHVFNIASDKNKKGGFEPIVEAEKLMVGALLKVNDRALDNDSTTLNHLWSNDVQSEIASAMEIWKSFLMKEGMFNNNFRRQMSENYIIGLVLTGQFDSAQQFLNGNIPSPFEQIPHVSEIKRLKELNWRLRMEYERYANERGWVRAYE